MFKFLLYKLYKNNIFKTHKMNLVKYFKFLYILSVLCLRYNITHNKCYYTFDRYRVEKIEKNKSASEKPNF